jgi:DNA-binding MarR family transcriptional regulator
VPFKLLVRRPEGSVSDIGERRFGRGGNRRQAIHGLRSVGLAEEIRASVVKDRTFFGVVSPVRYGDVRTALFVRLDRILIDGRINEAEIVQDLGSLRAFAGAEKAGNCNGGKESDDRHYDHDFNQRKAGTTSGLGMHHIIARKHLRCHLSIIDINQAWSDTGAFPAESPLARRMTSFHSPHACQVLHNTYERGLSSDPSAKHSDLAAMAAFRYALRKFLRFSKELLAKEANVTVEQYEALLALRVSGSSNGMQVGQLSERLQVRPHTAVALTNKLMDRGLVSKRRAPRDRRHVYVRLTAAGTQLADRLAGYHRREISGRSGEMIEALSRLREHD